MCSYMVSAVSDPLKRILIELHFQELGELTILNHSPSKTIKNARLKKYLKLFKCIATLTRMKRILKSQKLSENRNLGR